MTFIDPSEAMTNARGMVGRNTPAVSASLPSRLRVLKFDGIAPMANRKFPPWASVAGSCGLMSLADPTSALPPADGAERWPDEQPATTSVAVIPTASRRNVAVKRRGAGECVSVRRMFTALMLAAIRIRLGDSGE